MTSLALYNQSFITCITHTYGSKGVAWLEQLPTLIVQCAQKWNLKDLEPFPNLTYSYVLKGKRGGVHVVLKLRCNQKELKEEIDALQALNKEVSVELMEYDRELGALLLEQIIPGISLAELVPIEDEKATHIAAEIIQHLQSKNPMVVGHLPVLEQALPTFDKSPLALASFIPKVQSFKKELLSTPKMQRILHGDFHHNNILLSQVGWKVIDPKSIVGDVGYDLAVFIRNPLEQLVRIPHLATLILNRFTNLAALLRYDLHRLYKWTYLQTVAAAYWALQDGLSALNYITFLTTLHSIESDLI